MPSAVAPSVPVHGLDQQTFSMELLLAQHAECEWDEESHIGSCQLLAVALFRFRCEGHKPMLSCTDLVHQWNNMLALGDLLRITCRFCDRPSLDCWSLIPI